MGFGPGSVGQNDIVIARGPVLADLDLERCGPAAAVAISVGRNRMMIDPQAVELAMLGPVIVTKECEALFKQMTSVLVYKTKLLATITRPISNSEWQQQLYVA